MNCRGVIINHHIKNQREAVKLLSKLSWVGKQRYFERDKQIDRVVISSYVLANKDKFEAIAMDGYRSGKTIEEIAKGLYEDDASAFVDVDALDVGFDITEKDDVNTYEWDFSLYIPELETELIGLVKRMFNRINSHTLKLQL